MDSASRRRLAARGLVVTDSSGRDAVRVYLQYKPDVVGASRDERRSALRDYFKQVARARDDQGLELDQESLSVSGQTIEALVPVDSYDDVTRDIAAAADLNVEMVQSFEAT